MKKTTLKTPINDPKHHPGGGGGRGRPATLRHPMEPSENRRCFGVGFGAWIYLGGAD